MKRFLPTWATLMALMMLFVFTGCSDDDDDGGTGPNGTPVDQFEVVRTAASSFLAGPTPITTSIALNDLLTNGSSSDDPYVLSVRSSTHYAIGHVPGAANIGWKAVADPANLATLPTDEPIVAYCYTGHTGQAATTVLGVLGYDVKNMKFGMLAWSKDADVRATAPYSPPTSIYPLETTANTPTQTYDLPELNVSSSSDANEILIAASQAALGLQASPVTTADAAIAAGLENYFIVSVRSAAHYALGHIPGAINIPWKQIADADELAKLPTDQPILVYCYTGHTGQIATTVLRLLGYDAVNLKFGMSAWTTDTAVMGGVAPFDEADFPDLATESTQS